MAAHPGARRHTLMRLRMSRASLSVVLATGTLIVAVLAVSTLLARNLYTSALADGRSQADRFVTGAQAAVNRSLLGVDVLLASLNSLAESGKHAGRLAGGTALGKTDSGGNPPKPAGAQCVAAGCPRHGHRQRGECRLRDQSANPARFCGEAINLPVSTLVISQPVISPRSSEQVLFFGRHLKLADGSKLLAVAEVPVNLITTILVQGADISQLEATLERGNGQLLASMPAQDALTGVFLNPALGNNASLQAQEMQSRIQQKPALVASRPMLYNDLLITASIPMDTVIADWRFQVRLIALVASSLLPFSGRSRVLQRCATSIAWAVPSGSISDAKATTDRALESMESGFLLLDAQRRVVTWNRRYLEMYPWQTDHIKAGASFEALLKVTARETLGDVPEQDRVQWVANRMTLMSQGVHSHEREFPSGRIIEITERPTPDGGVGHRLPGRNTPAPRQRRDRATRVF